MKRMRITIVFDAESSVEFDDEMIDRLKESYKKAFTKYEPPILAKWVATNIEEIPS